MSKKIVVPVVFGVIAFVGSSMINSSYPRFAEFLGAEYDAQVFFSKVDGLSLVQGLCVIYKAKAYWRTGPLVDGSSQYI